VTGAAQPEARARADMGGSGRGAQPLVLGASGCWAAPRCRSLNHTAEIRLEGAPAPPGLRVGRGHQGEPVAGPAPASSVRLQHPWSSSIIPGLAPTSLAQLQHPWSGSIPGPAAASPVRQHPSARHQHPQPSTIPGPGPHISPEARLIRRDATGSPGRWEGLSFGRGGARVPEGSCVAWFVLRQPQSPAGIS